MTRVMALSAAAAILIGCMADTGEYGEEDIAGATAAVGEGGSCGVGVLQCDRGLTCCYAPYAGLGTCEDTMENDSACGDDCVPCRALHQCSNGHCCPEGQVWCDPPHPCEWLPGCMGGWDPRTQQNICYCSGMPDPSPGCYEPALCGPVL